MSDDLERTQPTSDASWSWWASAAVGSALFFGALFGFIIVPAVQGSTSGVGAWTAICRAVGVSPGSPAVRQPTSSAAPEPVSKVSWSTGVIAELHKAKRQEGIQIASTICAACHGANGISTDPQFPNLAGQSRFAIYKELHDFKSGARVNAIMTPMAQQLSEQQMADVAAFYSHFARGTLDPQLERGVSEETRNLVQMGDVARTLPPCNACHGRLAGGPIETPTLTGQHHGYLEAQLQAFASGKRKNDIYRRMRNVAGKLTPGEMNALAAYYAAARIPGRGSTSD